MTSRQPQPIGQVLSELLTRRGYARVQSAGALAAAWVKAVGEPWSAHSRAGNVRRGVLEVVVANSVLMQELTYRKLALLEAIRQQLPEERINDLRFRVGVVR